MPKKVQAQAQPISNDIGEANAVVSKLKRRTRRSMWSPRKVQAQVQPILNAMVVTKSKCEANAAIPESKHKTKRHVGRSRKVLISYAFDKANAAVPVQMHVKNVVRLRGNATMAAAAAAATATVGRPNPTKSKSRTGSSVGRPRKDEVVRQRGSSKNDVRCLKGKS
ncbi:hypothetical protein LWI28_010329 [Acer negundo]|uniref:Uncharacterized protein n=1 Tax=Acer negundo TaxID=4023 RepID=A0AAD5NLK0_ACENE|nr:hypothetical protein LWI28_010329 [Acer negundo]